MPNIDFDEIVKRSVQSSFGHQLDYFTEQASFRNTEGIVLVPQAQKVDDESGREYFMWGVSTWGGNDLVKE